MGSLCTSESKTKEPIALKGPFPECERRRVSLQQRQQEHRQDRQEQQQQQQQPEPDHDFSSLEYSEPHGSNTSGGGTTSDDDLSPDQPATTSTSPSDPQQRPMKSPESPPAAPQTAPPVNGSDEDFGSRRIRKHQQPQPNPMHRNNADPKRSGGSVGGSGGSSGSEEEGGGTGGSGSGSGSNGVTRSGSGAGSGSGGRSGSNRVGSTHTPTTTTTGSDSYNSAETLHPSHVQLFGDESLKRLHRLGIAQSNAELDSTGSPNPSGDSSTGSGQIIQGGEVPSNSTPPLDSSDESLVAIKPARPYADGPRGGHNLKGGAPSAIRSLVSDTSRSRRREQQQQPQQHPSSSSDTMVPEKIVLPVPPTLFPVAALVRDNDQHVSSAVQRRVTNWQDDVE